MALNPPFPNSPKNGDALDASPVLANLQAVYDAIQSFDGSQIASKSVVEAALADAINPRLRGSETLTPFVASGLVWTAGAGLLGSMTSGVLYYNGYRKTVNAISNHTFTASKDTYIDIDYLGNVYYTEVANGATSPALTANSTRIAKVVTNGSAITSVVQTGKDSLGNWIDNTNPSLQPLLKWRQGGTTGDNTWQTAGTSNTDTSAKAVFIQCGCFLSSASADFTLTFPVAFTYPPLVFGMSQTTAAQTVVECLPTPTATQAVIRATNLSTNRVAENIAWFAIGQ